MVQSEDTNKNPMKFSYKLVDDTNKPIPEDKNDGNSSNDTPTVPIKKDNSKI